MPHTVNYRIQFKTVSDEQVTVDIEDTASTEGTAVFTELEGSAQPLVVETINNGQDVFQPILAKSAKIQFLSTATYNSDTFSQGTDNRFKVTAYTASETIFIGFLLMDDIEERFTNPAFHNIVTLTATDNIGTLKEQEYRLEIDGEPIPDSNYLVMAPLLFPLKQTGLELPLNIVWNVFEEDFDTDDSPLNQLYIWTLTFEKEVTTKEDAYTVLQKVLTSLKARLFQWRGEWWLVRIHEYRTSATTLTRIKYDSDGVLVSSFADVDVSASIGGDLDLFFINADAQKVSQRPHKYDQDSYEYEYPREIIPNINFSRGDEFGTPTDVYDEDYKPEADTDTTNELFGTRHTYELDNWTLYRSSGAAYVANNTQAYIERVKDLNGVEDSREVVMTAGTAGNQYYLVSEGIPMHRQDKFNAGIEWRLPADIGGTSGQSFVPIMQLRLTGDDGSRWLLNDASGAGTNNAYNLPRWVNVSAGVDFINLAYFVYYYWDVTTQNESEWMGVSVEAPPLPVNGTIQVALIHANPLLAYNKHFQNLQFDYLPYINGTYAKYTGQYNKITQTEGYKANRVEEVFASHSPKKLFKGALKKYNGTAHVLVENWTDAFSGQGPMRIDKILVYDIWNQYKDPRSVIRGTIRGQMAGFSGLLNKFTLPDYNAAKRFILLSEEVDIKRLETTGELMEVFDTGTGNDYTTQHEFKYEQ